MVIFQLFLVCLLPIHLFSWSFTNWFQTEKKEKVDFNCPQHCGEWGTEAIRSLEWEFVQCLYDAHEMSNYIEKNFQERREGCRSRGWGCPEKLYPSFISMDVEFLYPRPQNFSSEWYQKALEGNSDWFVCFSDSLPGRWFCAGSQTALWQIQHLNHGGLHIGKCFKRHLYLENIETEDEENDGRLDYQTTTRYKFGNFIDFHNTCLALETDILREKNANWCRRYDISPQFKQQIDIHFSKVNHTLCDLKKYYQNIFVNCARDHKAPSAFYTLALLEFQKGEYTEAIDNVKILLDKVNVDDLDTVLASNIYTSKGEAEVEVARYDEAIPSLSTAIERNPLNQEAYFQRAVAYFETGEFDLSLKDYLASGKDTIPHTFPNSWEVGQFALGIASGGAKGLAEASAEFLPSLYASVHGIGNLLWTTVTHPIETPKQFAAATMEFFDYLHTCDKAELAETLVPELYELVINWDSLGTHRKGELAGYALGKYGTDILLPVATLKGLKYVKSYQGIRKAEKLCTLETLAKSPKSKAALTEAAKSWQEQRKVYFAKLQLETDKQGKHILGAKNYKEGNSIWTHSEPNVLLKEHAGKGQKIQGIAGDPGYRERVDFGETIGFFVNDKTKEKLPTTVGIIHYSKKGAHIVPAQPKK